MGWLIALAVIAGIAILPVGIRGVYGDATAGAWLLLGPFKFRLYPRKPNKKKTKKAKSKTVTGNTTKKKGDLQDFYPIARTVLEFLEQLRKKVWVRNLELKVILAGGDPCDLAVNYGRAWATLGSLMPQLDRVLLIRKRNVDVKSDFVADSTRVYARVDAVLTVARALHIGIRYGIKIIKEFLKLKKLRKGGAEL